MFDSLEVLKQAHAMARHAGARQTLIARNIANSDTPGYRPSDLPRFERVFRQHADPQAMRSTRPGHLHGGESSVASFRAETRPIEGATSPNGNGVSIEAEMLKAAEVRSQHELALSIYQATLGLLRTSLGRPR